MRRLAVVAAVALVATAVACSDDSPGGKVPPGATSIVLYRHGRAAPLPLARTEVAAVLWGGRIVVLGGYVKDGSTSAQVDAYDPKTDSWSRLPDLPAGRNHAGAAVLDSRLFVAGGFSKTEPMTTVWSIGGGETRWRTEAPLRHGRAALALVGTESSIVAVGGVDEKGQLVAATERLVRGRGWVDVGELPHPREHLAATVDWGNVVVIGGRVGSPADNRVRVDILRGNDTWAEGPPLRTPRGGIGAATLMSPAIPCVTGGETPTKTIATIECAFSIEGSFLQSSGTWVELGRLDVPRHGLGVVAVGNTLHVIGGGAEPGLFVSDVHEVFEFGPKASQ